jgi:hypothetical protein
LYRLPRSFCCAQFAVHLGPLHVGRSAARIHHTTGQ